MDLKDIRQEYLKHELKKEDLSINPFDQLNLWYNQAVADENHEPTAMTLSTLSIENEINSRIVLLKEVIEDKLRFFTNYNSQKGHDIEANPKVALLFFWPMSERQVRIKGTIKKCTSKDSDEYFYSRPIGSQAGAIASPQSKVLKSKDELIYNFEAALQSESIKRPESWGGYDVDPFEIEFWQGGMNRLHDRFKYTKQDGSWKIERLAP